MSDGLNHNYDLTVDVLLIPTQSSGWEYVFFEDNPTKAYHTRRKHLSLKSIFPTVKKDACMKMI